MAERIDVLGTPDHCDILALAAHPDDIEITSGGYMIKAQRSGRTIGAVDFTRGEMGTQGTPETRLAEAKAASEIMKMTYRGNLAMPDSGLLVTQESRLAVAQTIRDLTPELVILPHWTQRHPDHTAAYQIGYDACFIAGLKAAPLDGEPHRPRRILYASYYRNTDFSFLVDISDVFQTQVDAIAAYASQFKAPTSLRQMLAELYDKLETAVTGEDTNRVFSPGISIYDLLHTRSHELGNRIGVAYAEPYTVREILRLDDPLAIPGRSI